MDFKKFLGIGDSKPVVAQVKPVAKVPVKAKVAAPTQSVKPKVPGKPQIPQDLTQATSKKKLGFFVLLFIVINSILGSSLFYLPGLGMSSSGAASIIAWVVLFALASWMMLYIGELASLFPSSGGTYEYCKKAYGRFGSFMAGWGIWIAGNFGMALNIVAAAQYFIPETGSRALILQMIFVVIWIFVLNYMAFRGIDAGSTMLLAFGIIATVTVLAMIIPSFIDFPTLFSGGGFTSPFDTVLFEPFFQHEGTSIYMFLGLSLLLISEAFFGFEAVTYMGNEAKEPRKLHRVIISGVLICAVIMVIYIISSMGTVPYSDYVKDLRPFAVQAFNTLGATGKEVLVFGMYLVIVGAAAAWPIAGSRLLQAMAGDKLFIKQLAVLHPKHKSPHRAVYFQSVMVLLFSWFIFRGDIVGWKDSYRSIYLIYVLLSLLVVSMIVLAVPILRRKYKELERPFRAPFGTIGPIILVLIFFGLIGNWLYLEGGGAWAIARLALSFLFLGIPFFFMVQMFYSEKAIKSTGDSLAWLSLITEKLFFSFGIKKKLLESMNELAGKQILEYGCSVGILTEKLAHLVQAHGKLFAVDISKTKLGYTQKRVKKHVHVQTFHEPSLVDFTVHLPHTVDGVVSIGMLSSMQKPQQILNSIGKFVKKGGEIIFVDYEKFFYLIPNVAWIENDVKLKQMFATAGFDVQIEHKKGLFETIIITGWKV